MTFADAVEVARTFAGLIKRMHSTDGSLFPDTGEALASRLTGPAWSKTGTGTAALATGRQTNGLGRWLRSQSPFSTWLAKGELLLAVKCPLGASWVAAQRGHASTLTHSAVCGILQVSLRKLPTAAGSPAALAVVNFFSDHVALWPLPNTLRSKHYCLDVAQRAHRATGRLATLRGEAKNAWLTAAARLLREHEAELIAANEHDVARAAEFGLTPAEIDRLAADAQDRSSRWPRRWKKWPRCPSRSAK